jgi:hypothetical protein
MLSMGSIYYHEHLLIITTQYHHINNTDEASTNDSSRFLVHVIDVHYTKKVGGSKM